MDEQRLADLREFAENARVTDWFLTTVRDSPDLVALRAKAPDGEGWTELTYRDYAQAVARVAGALRSLGVGPGDRVMLFVRNRPEFHIADIAILMLRATPISIYNSSAPEQIAFLAGHSGAKVAIVDDGGFLDRLLAVRDELPGLDHVVVCDPPAAGLPDGVLGWDALDASDPLDLDDLAAQVSPEDLATVIYTSGTTGNPKGVLLDHRNFGWQVGGYGSLLATSDVPIVAAFPDLDVVDVPLIGPYPAGTRYVSYLPMAHIAERMVTHYSPLLLHGTVTCCPDQLRLAEYLVAVRPTIVFGPPRVWEKLRAGIMAAVTAAGPDKEAGFGMALAIGQRYDELNRAGEPIPEELAGQYAAVQQLAFTPLTARVGLDQTVVCFSGAAPLPAEVAQFFRSIGVNFSEVYGMSENTGGMTWSPFAAVPGTVGRPWPGAEVTLADDGEVIARGGILARGYLGDPARTAETFDEDGWLHTGDIGQWADNGDLMIVDRKKELIITAGGKNISPANIEARLKQIPLVGQAAVIGDGRKYLAALLVLDPDAAVAWAAAQGKDAEDLAALAADPEVLAAVQAGVDEVNGHFSNVEQVRRFALIGQEWLPDSEQLTATMKLKRRGVAKVHADLIEELYPPA